MPCSWTAYPPARANPNCAAACSPIWARRRCVGSINPPARWDRPVPGMSPPTPPVPAWAATGSARSGPGCRRRASGAAVRGCWPGSGSTGAGPGSGFPAARPHGVPCPLSVASQRTSGGSCSDDSVTARREPGDARGLPPRHHDHIHHVCSCSVVVVHPHSRCRPRHRHSDSRARRGRRTAGSTDLRVVDGRGIRSASDLAEGVGPGRRSGRAAVRVLRSGVDRRGDQVAQTVQLIIEYAPQPPYEAGAVDTAPAAVLAEARRTLSA